MISPDVKDIIDTIASVGTVLGFISVGVGWWITRRESKQKAETAIAQIDSLATNHFPHMQESLAAVATNADRTNRLLEEQAKVLTNIDKNIAVLCDRPRD